MSAETIAFVFARGGSKGVPGKNLRPLGGKPLVALAVEQARAASSVDRVVISTDDEEIAAAAVAAGAEAPFRRPPELAGDNAPEWLAWRHAITTMTELGTGLGTELGTFVCVPATSPFRDPVDINACVARLGRGDVDVALTVTPAARSPWFNMVTLDGEGRARLVIEPEGPLATRQAAPRVFDITTVCYAARPEFVLSAASMFAGRVGAVEVPAERALDIDTEYDMRLAELLWADRNKGG